MTSLFDDEFSIPNPAETFSNHEPKLSPRQKAEKAYRDLNSRSYAELAISRAGRNASPDDLRSIAGFILEEAKNREAK